MMRNFSKLAMCASLAFFAIPPDAFGGRGGGRGGFSGGGMQRGGAAGMQRGAAGGMQRGAAGGMQRGGAGGAGGMQRGRADGGINHSPSFSQPRNPGGAGAVGRNPYANGANNGAAAAGAGAPNRNQLPNNGAAAAGAGAANRNQLPNDGAAVAGAGIANRNQYPNAGAAAAGATYANRNRYDIYHPGMSYGYWNGNYGAVGMGSYAGAAMAAGAYGYGASPYMNPYAMGGGQVADNSVGPNYSQPLDTSAPPPDTPPPADPNTSPIAQARQAFQGGDYTTAYQLTQQALGQMPNDATLSEFLGLILFAQGNYEQAAAPLYAVLSAGPGWDWTTLISNYADASVYTKQLRGLEAFVRANPRSAQGQFVLSYHYITQGQGEAAVKHLKAVVALQPDDNVSAQLLRNLEPPSPGASDPAAPAPSVDPSRLNGTWTAKVPPDAKITLTLSDDANFRWVFAPPGKDPMTIQGTYELADGVLTLNGKDTPGGPLVGKVTVADDKHMTFKAVSGPPKDPGLEFSR
jgi:tetratricopeptide (TPR) repeat protein